MKKLHYPIREFVTTLNNGETYTETYAETRYCTMRYSEPNDRIENTYSCSNIRDFIEKYCLYIYTDLTWKFKKYIRFDGMNKKILISDINSIVVSMKHEEVPNYRTINDIGKKLPHDEFLQFVFDKEQELRSVITSMGE